MHPSAALIIWLAAVFAIQFVGYAGLGALLVAALLLTPQAVVQWLSYLRRARWLLVSLFLILAYNTPGEALNDLAWAPSYEGVDEAGRQATRLVVTLACLAVLFVRLERDGLICALWGVLQPLRRCGLDVDRLVVRLSLVLENLQSPGLQKDWRSMLALDAELPGGASVVSLHLPRWAFLDVLYSILAAGLLVGAIVL
ncbi:hypothetical protein KI614_11520 [Dechloromonas denitrificans]|uniref:hypothetical protein n=1 Tax=Dechloromonas denitrificans TaxID=281362 RepID=UPI001CF83F5D|nr:hypothetical protein [Dechloromonas denitrificans]UCV10803.1 hypothetical protein KI614_11520 [Dechloromonas denitrificans]